MPRVAIHLLGVELVAFEITPDDDPAAYAHTDLESEVIYADPEHPIGFTLPSTEWGDDDDDDSAE